MHRTPSMQDRGFVLLEALIALLVAAFAIYGIVKLQGYITKGAAESVAASEAISLAQERVEQLRTSVSTRAGFNALPTVANTVEETINGTNATRRTTNTVYTRLTTIQAGPASGPESRAVRVDVSWTDSNNSTQTYRLDAVIGWDDPLGQAIASIPPAGSMIAPVGAAKKGVKTYSPIPQSATDSGNNDGLKYHTTDNKTRELIAADGRVLLYLDPKNNAEQAFTTITGGVHFDENAGNNALPDPDQVQVRLSSEGVCVKTLAGLTTAGSGANTYRRFNYVCYVGPGWYGNVGVTVSGAVTGNAADATTCVGDPAFNGGVSNSTLVSAHPVESGTRTYRGFRAAVVNSVSTYLSTGVAGGSHYPTDGAPLPSDYPASYGAVASGQNFFNHHFLLTNLSGSQTCNSKMTGGEFLHNAGKYYCINPHNSNDAPVCPSIWPNFESEVGAGGGSLNYLLSVTRSGSGAVTSSVGGISCGTLCAASIPSGTAVTLTATPVADQTINSWTGCDTSSGMSCVVTMTGAKAVTADFSQAPTFGPLTVTMAGSGTGTVTSSVGGISCTSPASGTCSVTFTSNNTSVILTAAPGSGSTFVGWSGAVAVAAGCSSATTCTVSVSSATDVTATFNAAAPPSYTLAVTKTGTGAPTGTVTSGAGTPLISCGATCSSSVTAGSKVMLTATGSATSAFTGWSGGGCSGTDSTCEVTVAGSTTVSASFGTSPCTTPLSGTLPSGAHDAPIVTPNGAGACTKGTGSNFSCSLTAAEGAKVTLTSSKSSAQPDTMTTTVQATCGNQTGVKFQ